MLRKTFSCSELCSRWDISMKDLRGIVCTGELKVMNDNYPVMSKEADGYLFLSSDGKSGVSSSSPYLLIEDESYFTISDVLEYERENGIKRHPQEKSLAKKRILKDREMFAYNEANRLRHKCPDMNRVMAKKTIDILMKQKHLQPYSRTQFNRIVDDLGFPLALRGRRPSKKSY